MSEAPPGTAAPTVILEADERNLCGRDAAPLADAVLSDLGGNFGGLLPYNSAVHSLLTLCGPGPGVSYHPRGHFLSDTLILHEQFDFVYILP